MSGTPESMLTLSLHNNLSGRGHGNPSSSHRRCPLEHTRGLENTLHPHHGFTARGERVTQLRTHLRPSRILDFNTRRESGSTFSPENTFLSPGTAKLLRSPLTPSSKQPLIKILLKHPLTSNRAEQLTPAHNTPQFSKRLLITHTTKIVFPHSQ